MGDQAFQLQRARLARPAVFGLALAALTTGLGACSSTVAHRQAGAYVGDQGAGWNVVLPSPDTQTADAWSELNAEYARRDYALGVPPDTSQDIRNAWDDPARPDVDQARRLFISRQADTFMYFRSSSSSASARRSDWSRSGPQ